MAQKWNLQDIRPAGSAKPQPPVRDFVERTKVRQDIAPRAPKIEEPQAFDDSDLESIDIVDGNDIKKKRVIVTTTVALIIIGVSVLVNVFLGGAEVLVYPKIKDVSVQSNFMVYTEPQVNELGYELLKLDTTGERQVKASGKEAVSLRAEGKIFVYNVKSTSPQRLIKNTRFESKDGLIYRIKESIEVPGVTKDAKGNVVPGSIVADVFADSTGEKYNLAPGRFTVPGLKDTEQFDSVYGESTSAFTGGFEGEKFIIDEQELNTAKQALHIDLRDKLLKRLTEEMPAGFVAYPDAVTFVFESLPSTEYEESFANIKEKAILQIPIFKETDFAKYLAEKSVPDYGNEEVTLFDPKTLVFSYTDPLTNQQDISASGTLDITLKGNTRIVWKFDEEKLKKELAGIKKTAGTTVFGTYNSISHAQAEVRPFWATSFPENTKDINIKTLLEE